MRITVGVPCFRQQDHLNGLLASLQQREIDEVVVVDDGSPERIRSNQSNLPVRVIKHNENQGLAAARNTIATHADGDFILFLDCDVRMRSFSREDFLKAFADPTVVALTGSVAEDGSLGTADRWRSIFWRQDHGPLKRQVDLAYGLCSAWRRDQIRTLGGFARDLRSHGEDVDLSIRAIRAGFSIVHEPSLSVVHKRHDTLSSLLRMVWNHSFFYSSVCRTHGHPNYRRSLLNSLKWAVVAPASSLRRHHDPALAGISIPCCLTSICARLVCGLLPRKSDSKNLAPKSVRSSFDG